MNILLKIKRFLGKTSEKMHIEAPLKLSKMNIEIMLSLLYNKK